MTATTQSSPPAPAAKLEGKFAATVVCCFLGFGSLVAWNSMLTISDYYYELFPKYHPSKVLTLVYQPFANVTMVILAIYESKLNTRKRNIFGYILFTACTFGLIVLDLATSGKGGVGPYLGICALVACFGIADAHVQGGVMGDLSFMCPEFIQSFLAGLAASGALTSGLRLVTKAAFDKDNNGQRKGTLLFLAIATVFEFACIFLYAYVFPKLQVVKHYRAKAALEGSKTVSADLAVAGIQTAEVESEKRLGIIELLRQKWDYALDIYLIYVFTLSIYPGFIFENTGSNHQLGSWYPLVLIAFYNVWDLISRYIPLIKCLKIENRKVLLYSVLSRFLLIPAFYFAGKYAAQGWMMLLTSFMGITNGYLTVCVLTAAPQGYRGPEQNAIGNLLVLFLLAGIFTGVALDWLWDI
jgi:equilibrative nucleoside transporter 1/2/3